MKHAREDYNRIQDPAGKIPDDEPVFLIRGQDALAPEVLHFYADRAEIKGASPEIVSTVREHADRMNRWQARNKVKTPDLPEDMDAEVKAMEEAAADSNKEEAPKPKPPSDPATDPAVEPEPESDMDPADDDGTDDAPNDDPSEEAGGDEQE